MSIKRPTKKEKKLISEIDEMMSLFRLDYREFGDEDEVDLATKLEHVKNQLVRSEVVTSYTLVDELLGSIIAKYQFGADFVRLWKTKKFTYFNHHVLEELSIMAKLRYVKSIRDVHKSVSGDIERLASLRNGLAHSFFPENLRKSKPEWKGQSIFAVEGAIRFVEDMGKVYEHLLTRTPYKVTTPGVAEVSPRPAKRRNRMEPNPSAQTEVPGEPAA